MTRYGSFIEIRPEMLAEYLRLHEAVWPEVCDALSRANLRNLSIFHRQFPDGRHYVFLMYDYIGEDHDADMAGVASDAKTREWWRLTDPCQVPLANVGPADWWAPADHICYLPLTGSELGSPD